jgi:hypothetical protein
MRASDYVTFIISFGLGLPLFIVCVFYVHRWLPRSLINLPRKNFWLAPERLPDTHRYLARRGLWLGCIVLLLMLGLHFTVVRANQLTPPHLAPKCALLLLILFLAALVVWMIIFVRHFLRAETAASEP